MLGTIRDATNQGMVLGNDRFKKEVEQLSHHIVTTLEPGPKPKLNIDKEFLQ
jgi:hypothetical protein